MPPNDFNGVPVHEPAGPPPRKRPRVPLPLLFGILAALLAGGGAFAWFNRPAPEADATPAPLPRPLSRPQAVPPLAGGPMVGKPMARVGRPPMAPKAPPTTHAPMKTALLAASMPAAGDQMSQFRHTFEASGWSVYWLDAQNEATAWKSLGKTGYEVRLKPGARQATVLKTGGRGIILKRWTVALPADPFLRGDHVYANANTLLRGALTHDR